MQNFNLTQQKYTENAVNMQLIMPLNIEVLIPENDSVRLLNQIVEELDLTDLKMAYSSKGRNPKVPPRILFQLLAYAYMNGIYSSRKVELACKRDINFMWLLEGYPAPDATFMHMKEDHMRNSQLKPGDNIQIGVEGGYVVGVDVSTERSDKLTLIPFLKRLEKNLPKTFRNIIADAGYESEEIYLYLKKHRQRAYIKPQIYEQWKKRNFKNLIGKRENMIYHKDEDIYECNQGRRLKKVNRSSRVSKSGYRSAIAVYECENCEGCPVKSKCTKAKGNRRMDVSKKFLKLRERSLKNMMTPKGIVLRMNRSIQVEGAFGIMKEDYGF